MNYMMLIHHDDAALAKANPKELWADYAAFNEALAKAGGRSGARLQPVAGADAALAELCAISTDKRIRGYQPYWATLGHLNLRAGNIEAGREALRVAIGLSTDDAVRQHLRLRLGSSQAEARLGHIPPV